MKEARVQVKVPLVPRPEMHGSEEHSPQDEEKDRLIPAKMRINPLQMAKVQPIKGSKLETKYTKPDQHVTMNLKQEAIENIKLPLIELDAFRKVKRRRMRTLGRVTAGDVIRDDGSRQQQLQHYSFWR